MARNGSGDEKRVPIKFMVTPEQHERLLKAAEADGDIQLATWARRICSERASEVLSGQAA